MLKHYDEEMTKEEIREVMILLTVKMLETDSPGEYYKLSEVKYTWMKRLFNLEDKQ